MDGPDSDDSVAWTTQTGKELLADEDAQLLRHVARFVQQRRRRRARVWLGAVSVSIVIGLFGAAFVRSHTATPTTDPPPFVGINAQGRIATPAGESGSAAIAQRTPTSTRPPVTTIQPDRDVGSPAPAAPETSPAVAPAYPRVGGELTF